MYEKADVKGKKRARVRRSPSRRNWICRAENIWFLLDVPVTATESLWYFTGLYDVCSLTVISDPNTVGYYDRNSKVTLSGSGELWRSLIWIITAERIFTPTEILKRKYWRSSKHRAITRVWRMFRFRYFTIFPESARTSWTGIRFRRMRPVWRLAPAAGDQRPALWADEKGRVGGVSGRERTSTWQGMSVVPNLERSGSATLNDMVFGEQFDYTVLNGVFEYAPGFTEGISRARRFLRISNGCLPEGSCWLQSRTALDSSILRGAPEDHTNGYFWRHCRVSGQSFRADILQRRGERLMGNLWFSYHRFDYPYPITSFRGKSLRDVSLFKRAEIWSSDLEFPTKYRIRHCSGSGQVAETIQQDGRMDYFANSFWSRWAEIRSVLIKKCFMRRW